MALKRNVAGLVFWVVLVPMANALEARGQSPVLMQVASSRSPPNAGFFLDEVTGGSTADRISDAVREGQRRTSIAEVEAVHVAHSRTAKSETGAKSSETKSLTSAEEFRLFPTMKLDRLKDASSKVMSLVAEGARAAAESVAPSAVKPPQSPTKKVQKAAPSALSLLGQMRQAKLSVLQRTDASQAAKAGQERQREESKDLQPQQPERLHSKSVAYDEAVAEEEAKRRHEEEAREEHAKMEDLMDEVRNRRSW